MFIFRQPNTINVNLIKDHIFKLSLLLSILLHCLFLYFFKSINALTIFPLKNDAPNQLKAENEKRLEFELVETPENARSNAPPEQANLISDKNAIAKDNYQAKDRPFGNPYSEGDFDIKNLPLAFAAPTQQSALKQNNNFSFNDKQEQDGESSDEAGITFEKFSRQELIKNQQENTPAEQQEINRPLYENRQFNAKELGGFSFNTYNWDFAPYLLAMKRKVERNIFPPPAFTQMGLISGETILRFKVLPNGEVKDLEVLSYIGHPSLKETSLQAIRNSSRFKPLPADFPENYLEVTASFSYFVNKR